MATSATSQNANNFLTLQRLYGLKGDVKDNIHYADERGETVIYPCGYNIVLYNLEKKTQKFISLGSSSNPNSSGSGDITCMAVSSLRSATNGRSRVVAVAERGGPNGRPSISIFDLSTGKRRGKIPLESKDVASKKYVSMCFSPDGRYLLAQGGAPDWTLINWQWEKGRPIQAARVSNKIGAAVHQCSYCPTDATVVCVSGNGILRFLHLEQSEFKSIQFSMGKREPQNYLCHCWIDDKILVGTDTGDIFVFENAEFKGVLESSPSDGKSIDSLAAYSSHPSGFVAGCDEGVLYVFERDEKEMFKQAKFFQIESNFVKIKNVSISPSEDNVICTLENNQAFVVGIQNTDLVKTEEMNFEPLTLPCHHLQITGMDLCLRKPLVVTCGLDRSIRVWNYNTYTIEVMRYFSEVPLSVAFHPSGLHIIAGFYDSMRLMNLLMGEIRPYKDFTIKGCREVQFSNGGQYFAAANALLIQVYQTFTCDLVATIPHKGKVTSLHWSQDDTSIYSTAQEGGVYQWFLKDGKQVMAPNLKKLGKCNYSCVMGGSDGRIYVVGGDRKLKIIDPQTEAIQIDADVVLTQLCLLQPKESNTKVSLLYAGAESGAVRTYHLNTDAKVLFCHI
jgi:WD40 repeat protein